MAIRAFIAVEAADEMVARLTAVQDALRGAEADVGWTAPAGLHLTLKFLGDVAESRIPGLTEALAAVAGRQAPFTIRVAGVGVFPNPRHPRIIWAGVTDGADALRALASDVEAAMTAAGVPPEERPFRAHLTLGRVRAPHGLQRLMPLLDRYAAEDFGAQPVASVTFMRSELSPHGARYTVLARLPLLCGGYSG
jgi:2'-5' RNA ligase